MEAAAAAAAAASSACKRAPPTPSSEPAGEERDTYNAPLGTALEKRSKESFQQVFFHQEDNFTRRHSEISRGYKNQYKL